MKPIPDDLTAGPFTRARARALGVTDRMLDGARFVRVLPRVFRHRDHVMTTDDWFLAASLALPDHARLTGISRIQRLGLDVGPPLPVRYVVEGDLHLDHRELFLHRTRRLPPTDEVGVTPAAAFIAYCRCARVIDAIKVGDWLLHGAHMTPSELRGLCLAEPWRDGAREALWVLEHLDGDARSLPESETRAVLSFAGLPPSGVNRRLRLAEDLTLIGDLVYDRWRTVVEYEGAHHQTDRVQYVSDLDRYAVMRRHQVGYVQVTREKLGRARTLVGEVHRELVSRGYDGPPPSCQGRWGQLFVPIHDVLASEPKRRVGGG